MSTIAAGTTTGTALVSTGDTSGALVFQTNGTTTALTLAANQAATFASTVAGAFNGTVGATTPAAGTFTSLTSSGAVTEGVHTLGTSGSIALNPANGTIQTCALSGNPTFTNSLSSGQGIVLMLTNGASYTVTWPTTTWVTGAGNVAPTLTAKDGLVFWCVGATLYGAYIGSYV